MAGNGSGGTSSASGGSIGTAGAPPSWGGASLCSDGEFLLCDGFEGSAFDSALWSLQKSGSNVIELTTDDAARGGQSVHMHIAGSYGKLVHRASFPVAGNHYFGRMFFKAARFSTVDWAHWTVGEAAGTGDGSLVRVGGQYATDLRANRFGVGSDGGPTGDWTLHDEDPNGRPAEPPVGEWMCLEWEHDGSKNETHLWVNDKAHPSLDTTSSEHGGTKGTEFILPEVTSFWFGFWQYQADPEPFDVWIDEVVLDDAPIGCQH